jgi:hypothetical protein
MAAERVQNCKGNLQIKGNFNISSGKITTYTGVQEFVRPVQKFPDSVAVMCLGHHSRTVSCSERCNFGYSFIDADKSVIPYTPSDLLLNFKSCMTESMATQNAYQ